MVSLRSAAGKWWQRQCAVHLGCKLQAGPQSQCTPGASQCSIIKIHHACCIRHGLSLGCLLFLTQCVCCVLGCCRQRSRRWLGAPSRATCWQQAVAQQTDASSSGTHTLGPISAPLTQAPRYARAHASVHQRCRTPSVPNSAHQGPNKSRSLGVLCTCAAAGEQCQAASTDTRAARLLSVMVVVMCVCLLPGVLAAVEPSRARDPVQPWLLQEPAVPVEVPQPC